MSHIEYLPHDFANGSRWSMFRKWLMLKGLTCRFQAVWTPNFQPVMGFGITLFNQDGDEVYSEAGEFEENLAADVMKHYRTEAELAAEAEALRKDRESAELSQEDQEEDESGAIRSLIRDAFVRIANLEAQSALLKKEVQECLKTKTNHWSLELSKPQAMQLPKA